MTDRALLTPLGEGGDHTARLFRGARSIICAAEIRWMPKGVPSTQALLCILGGMIRPPVP